MIRAICIDDKNMPSDYPDKNKWVKEDGEYTIIRVQFLTLSNTLAVQLNEIDMEDVAPYFGWFKLERFAIPIDSLEEFENLIRASKEEMNVEEFDVEKLFEELETVENY